MIGLNKIQLLLTHKLEYCLANSNIEVQIVDLKENDSNEFIKIVLDDVDFDRLNRVLYEIKCNFGVYYYKKDETKDLVKRGLIRNAINFAFAKEITDDDVYIQIDSVKTDWTDEFITGTISISYHDIIKDEDLSELMDEIYINMAEKLQLKSKED